MDESLKLQLSLKATQRDYLPQRLQIWQDGWMFLCLFALCAGKLNPWNRWTEGWPSQNHLMATHKSQIPDHSTWLVARLSLLKGRKSHLRAAPTFPFSVYLHMSDSSSNITLLTDPSVLLHVLPFKSQASRDNAVYSSNDCACLNGCAAIKFCSFYI